ncbi:MAG: twin-arginine translocase subunit TatC [Acidaminococcaceae bacterium]|nr:twin-arginine translocase subunit TatC [Acidaminococcaceae bacterium]
MDRNKALPELAIDSELAIANENSEEQLSLVDHIKELRKRLIYCMIVVTGCFFGIITYGTDWLMQLLPSPVKERGINLIFLGLSEVLTAQIKVAFIAAIIVSMPIILWQIWDFIKPALYVDERKGVLIFTFWSLLLFVLGVSFGYGVVFVSAITFFVYIGENIATPMLSISQYIGFMFSFVLSFGLVFEMPVITFVLCRLGITTPQQLKELRKYAVLVIFIVAAFLTPPDVFSQILMAAPMLVLYEVGIWAAKLGGPGDKR